MLNHDDDDVLAESCCNDDCYAQRPPESYDELNARILREVEDATRLPDWFWPVVVVGTGAVLFVSRFM